MQTQASLISKITELKYNYAREMEDEYYDRSTIKHLRCRSITASSLYVYATVSSTTKITRSLYDVFFSSDHSVQKLLWHGTNSKNYSIYQ